MSSELLQCKESSINDDAFDLMEKGSIDDAVTMLLKHLKENPEDVQAMHLLGTAYAKKGDFINAEKAFKNELKLNQSRVDAHFNLGLIHSQQNRLPEARDDFENVTRLNPDDAHALNDLGVISYTFGDIEKSQEYFSKALSVDPCFKDAFLNLFELSWNSEKYNLALEYAYNFLKKLLPEGNGQTTGETIKSQRLKKSPAARKSIKLNKSAQENIPAKPAVSLLNSRVISKSEKLELFNKHVPDELRDKKTGMNIALIADFDIAGQFAQLIKLINEKTIHRARCVILHDDHNQYGRDVVFSDSNNDEKEIAQKIIENADFYHVGRFPTEVEDFNIFEFLRPDNSIIQYFDGELQNNAKSIYTWHREKNITGLSIGDYSLLENSPLFYHVNFMFDTSDVKPAPQPEGTIKIAHTISGHDSQATQLFLAVVDRLQKNHDVEPIIIENKSNQECLELKNQAHMTFESLLTGMYGISAIESMAVGHVVFSGISNFAASIFPDNPIVGVTEDNLADIIEYFLKNRKEITEKGREGIAWVKCHHNPRSVLQQYLYFYDFVKNGHRVLSNKNEQLIG